MRNLATCNSELEIAAAAGQGVACGRRSARHASGHGGDGASQEPSSIIEIQCTAVQGTAVHKPSKVISKPMSAIAFFSLKHGGGNASMAIFGGMTAARSKGALAASDWES